MINRCSVIFLLLCIAALCHAQERSVSVEASTPAVAEPVTVMPQLAAPYGPDSCLPAIDSCAMQPLFMPYRYGWGVGSLHSGLNAMLDLSVFSTFGSGHTWSGAGFSQRVSLAYAMPLSKRISLAIGGYLANASWAHDVYRDAGVAAVMGYEFNDRWNGYLYFQKSLGKPAIPYPLVDLSDMGDRIGLAVDYKVTPSFHVGVSVEQRYNQPFFPY